MIKFFHRIGISFLIVSLNLNVACRSESNEKRLKNTNGTKSTVTINQPIATGEGTAIPSTTASDKIDGVQIYLDRCAACHGSIASSNKQGLDSGKIIDPYTKIFPKHHDVNWPNTNEALAIEQALAGP